MKIPSCLRRRLYTLPTAMRGCPYCLTEQLSRLQPGPQIPFVWPIRAIKDQGESVFLAAGASIYRSCRFSKNALWAKRPQIVLCRMLKGSSMTSSILIGGKRCCVLSHHSLTVTINRYIYIGDRSINPFLQKRLALFTSRLTRVSKTGLRVPCVTRGQELGGDQDHIVTEDGW